MKFTIIGESNIDIVVRTDTTDPRNLPPNSCSPSHIALHHGGVARNIAHNLSLWGHEVKLMTVFGDDDFAAQLIANCKRIGIDLSLSTQFANEKSPIFLSINQKTNDMHTAFSDVGLNNHMDLDWLSAKMAEINRSDSVVANTLLTTEALSYLIDYCKVPLYIDTVSSKRCLRMSEALEQSRKKAFHTLKCTLSEIEALTGKTDPMEAAKTLNANHIKNVYITMGPQGAIYGHEGEAKHFPALPANLTDAIGSGDAFLSGIVHANATGNLGTEAVMFALEMAKRNCETEGPVALFHP